MENAELAYGSALSDVTLSGDEYRTLAAENARLREAVSMALPLLEAFKENLDHLTCGDLCDATHEFRGCHGRCALEASEDAASAAIAAARALVESPR